MIESLEKILSESPKNVKTEKFEEFVNIDEKKIETFETNLSTVKECLAEKDSYIDTLETKVIDIEKTKSKMIESLEKILSESPENVK